MNMGIILLCIALIIAKLTLSLAVSWEHKIIVDGENGTDNNSCLQDDTLSHCATLNMALKGLRYNSTVIYIGPGTYTMEHGNETSITGKDQIAIIGRGKENTVINCSLSAGLEIVASSNVTIESVSFQFCGKNYFLGVEFVIDADNTIVTNVGFQAALSINYCSSVMLFDVSIQYSNGTGLLLVCVQGVLIIEKCLVHDNRASVILSSYDVFLNGGGIIFIEDNHCLSSNTYHLIYESIITSNDFKTYTRPYFRVLQHCLSNIGGGITFIYKYTASYTVIDACLIANNTRGLSIHGSFLSINITNTSIYMNQNESNLEIFPQDSSLNFFNVNMANDLVLHFHSLEDITIANSPGEYSVITDSFHFNVTHLNSNSYGHFPLLLKQTVCTINEDFGTWGRCFNEVIEKTRQCPITYSYCGVAGCSCEQNHTGRLCGECKDGYSVSISSKYLSCVPCHETRAIAEGWANLIGLEFVPVTVMVAVIAIFNVNLNQGSLNGYVFFCQILTIAFPSMSYPAWLVSNHDSNFHSFDLFLTPLRMWNLDFTNIPLYSICISKSTSPLGALSFWYLIALYPYFLLVLLYACITLYGKGYRCVVYVVRPFHCLLARLWQMFDIHPSLTHIIASVYTLCFTQLAATSLKILHPTWYEDESGRYHAVFFYDGTQPYFSGWHGLACTFAVLVLVFLITVTMYLFVNPFMRFQQCLNRIKFKKDFLISMTDNFTGQYKDGTHHNSRDYRYFAGLYFVLRLVVMMYYYIPPDDVTIVLVACLELALCVLTASAIIIFRPYKRNIHNFNEMILLIVLGTFSLCHVYPIPKDTETHFWIIHLVLPVTYFIVVMVVIPYCLLWIVRKLRCAYRYFSAFQMRAIQNGNYGSNIEVPKQQDEENLLADQPRSHGDNENYIPNVVADNAHTRIMKMTN